MRKIYTYLLLSFCGLTLTTSAQTILPTTSDENSGELINVITEKDTVGEIASFSAFSNTVPLPSAEMIADRLRCIEGTIPLQYNRAVAGFINFFTVRKRNYSQTMLERKDYYFPVFEEYLAKYGLPDELKYLSVVESGLNPRAVSRSGAVGLWQFMPATGYDFRLQQDAYIDERMDTHKATEAACRYLKSLYNIFGDWNLALAAYNCGPGNIRKAQMRSGKYSFWDIYAHLPAETRSYVPQFVAVTYMMTYAKEHNIFPDKDSTLVAVAHDAVSVSHYLHLDSLANQLQVPVQDLQLLNPSLRKYAVPHYGQHSLKLPADKITLFEAIRDSLSLMAETHWQTFKAHNSSTFADRKAKKIFYTVSRKDNLAKIAAKFGVRTTDIKQWNSLRSGKLKRGQMLIVWKKEKSRRYLSFHQSRKQKSIGKYLVKRVYRVQRGDTLLNIAQRYNGSVSDIVRLNDLKGSNIKPGQKLIIG